MGLSNSGEACGSERRSGQGGKGGQDGAAHTDGCRDDHVGEPNLASGHAKSSELWVVVGAQSGAPGQQLTEYKHESQGEETPQQPKSNGLQMGASLYVGRLFAQQAVVFRASACQAIELRLECGDGSLAPLESHRKNRVGLQLPMPGQKCPTQVDISDEVCSDPWGKRSRGGLDADHP
jgi:hypothetical protein